MNDKKELQLFRALIRSNLSRMVERAGVISDGKGGAYRVVLVKRAIAMAWDGRDEFDPQTMAWITWFEELLRQARRAVALSSDHEWLYEYLQEDEGSKPVTRAAIHHDPDFGPTRPALNLNALPRGAKDCPPCWRCRYFDGWLPPDEDDVEAPSKALEPDVAESCARIDANKLRIAQWVRDRGWEDMEV